MVDKGLPNELIFNIRAAFSGFSLEANWQAGAEIIILAGPSGSGKTLTLHMIAGLFKPNSGFIKVGNDIYYDSTRSISLTPQERCVGYVFQDYALFPHMTVGRNITYALRGKTLRESQRATEEMLDFLRIKEIEKCYPKEISGGQKQRVALARALVRKPHILLLDEPFAALDLQIRSILQEGIREIQNLFPIPIVLVTHDLVDAYALADKLVVYIQGRCHQVGPPEEVFSAPKTVEVARFVGTQNINEGEIQQIDQGNGLVYFSSKGHVFEAFGRQEHDLHPGKRIFWCIRPERIMILKKGRPIKDSLKENILEGNLISLTPKGASFLLDFIEKEKGLALRVEVPEHIVGKLNLGIGTEIRVSLKRSGIHFIPAL
ncbi:MAG: ABC transporter ATP-binding protein [Candidatus Tectomicrobia bacterium]|uniref:ABC transporter ATP-binding protein n=1 Tax=Tectimicrobiota bacterium TaxID=2528274 RepID=A0A933LRQ4_UNCTE|nr:ABC transporter ATP-binding protein [Candidatus Tectomicrobia bacterium]